MRKGIKILLVIAIFCLASSCSSYIKEKPLLPYWNGTIYASDYKNSRIIENVDDKKDPIKCSSVKFDDYACLTYEDLNELFSLIKKCECWPNY